MHELGMIYANRGEIEQAIALYQQSLEIKEQIGKHPPQFAPWLP
ncbi:MAG: tetratricopeptide repeat-containing protein [Limnothrix sp. CACIAM 69d]|nr:MAG: tetratricopeptide repeat-containing protein [Limnothrix sp. CACIAM 69d]